MGHKLTLISAPADLWKTTLVSEWVLSRDTLTAWLSLDEGDDDLTHFLNYFIAALQRLDLGQGAAEFGEGAFAADQLQARILRFLDLHEVGIMAYIFWGLWLFPLGYLVFKSDFRPKVLGILLMIACFGYLIDFSTFFLFPDRSTCLRVGRNFYCACGC